MKNPAVPPRRLSAFRSRFAILCLLSSFLFPLSAVAAENAPLTIKRVYTGWRDAASFKRISEYFNGQENTNGEAVFRTHPEQRAGFYFLVRVVNPGAARSVKATLHVITSANARAAEYQFPAELRAGDTVFHIGLTGTDWTDPKANPVAWKLDLTDANGQPLATEKSYLWEKPAVP